MTTAWTHELIQTVLLVVASLFPIVNPPGAALMVLGMVPRATSADRADLAARIALNGFALLAGSLAVGAYVLTFFGISIPVLRVAGGLVIAMAGWQLLQAPDAEAGAAGDDGDTDVIHAAALRGRAFYPLTLPLTVGPGSIAVAVALGTHSSPGGTDPVHLVGVCIALVLISISVYLCMRYVTHLERLLGASGLHVAMRLFAFVIFCIGLQLLWRGGSELLAGLAAQCLHPAANGAATM